MSNFQVWEERKHRNGEVVQFSPGRRSLQCLLIQEKSRRSSIAVLAGVSWSEFGVGTDRAEPPDAFPHLFLSQGIKGRVLLETLFFIREALRNRFS